MRKALFCSPAKLPFPLCGPDAQVSNRKRAEPRKKMPPTLKIFYPLIFQSPIGKIDPGDLRASPTAKYQPQHRLTVLRSPKRKARPPDLPFSVSPPRPVSPSKIRETLREAERKLERGLVGRPAPTSRACQLEASKKSRWALPPRLREEGNLARLKRSESAGRRR